MLQTGFTREYGVELPVISAGMAFVARAPLVAAVSAGGGFGTLGASGMPVDLLQAEIEAIRARTDRPFGINCIPRFVDATHVSVCAAARVSAVTFFWDEPDPAWVQTLREAGTRVWVQVGSPEQAREAVASGADAVIAQGSEAGGHNLGVAATMSLVPAVLDAVAPVPVFAAGGVADGRGLVAALALGAEAAVFGTRFLAAEEADANRDYQQRVVDSQVGDTARHWVFGFDFPDARVRGVRNAIVREWEKRDDPPPYRELDPDSQPIIGTASVFGQEMPMPAFTGLPPTRAASGDLEQMSLLAGESSGLIHDVPSAGEILKRIADEASTIISGLTAAHRNHIGAPSE
jgi:NAD(P)H-dependent flavin oxidoreductase YrpB (nitropropane dioxygenase family)